MHKTGLEQNPESIDAFENFVHKAVSILDSAEHMYKKCPWPKISVKGSFLGF